jgi:hypothetical protein
MKEISRERNSKYKSSEIGWFLVSKRYSQKQYGRSELRVRERAGNKIGVIPGKR